MRIPRFLWRLFHVGPRVGYALGLGRLLGRNILLLSTTGRKSGRTRVTPLTYELREDAYLVASARGKRADWVRNIQENPRVRVQASRLDFPARAEVLADLEQEADFMERQLARRPRFFGPLMRLEGLPAEPTREDFKALAAKRPVVALYPLAANG